MSIKTYQFIVELEDDPVNPFTEEEVEEIRQHIAEAMDAGIDLESSDQLMFLAGSFSVSVQEKKEQEKQS